MKELAGLEVVVADKLAEFFKDPVDIPCAYCEATRAIIPIIQKAVMAKERDLLLGVTCMETKIEEAKKAVAEEIIAWGIEPCPHWHEYPDVGVIKRDCSLCWQALKNKYTEEVKP